MVLGESRVRERALLAFASLPAAAFDSSMLALLHSRLCCGNN